jgi:hypothetical protein
MTTVTEPMPSTARRLSPVHEMFRRESLFAGAAFVFVLLMVPTTFAMLVDQRTFQGINVWVKPLKFQFSLAVYLATLAWFADWLPRGTTTALWYRAYAALVVFAMAAEIAWVGGAAVLGVGSHYNTAVRGLYPTMGGLAVLLTSASFVYGVLIWRAEDSRLNPVFRLSVSVSLVLTFVLTMIAAMTLSSLASHYIGSGTSDAHGVPIMGWSRTGGDLRVAHFFATHAMHVLPMAGLVVSALLPKTLGCFVVLLASVAYTVFVGFTFVEALQGRPFTLFGI